ncbi:hypothetical protein QQP08_024434 [Theobroma cacao]|nr:hypothetical protein QQP08_024434 [Theobroma cacao]
MTIKRHQCHHKVGGAGKWDRNSVEFEGGVEEDKEARAVDLRERERDFVVGTWYGQLHNHKELRPAS